MQFYASPAPDVIEQCTAFHSHKSATFPSESNPENIPVYYEQETQIIKWRLWGTSILNRRSLILRPVIEGEMKQSPFPPQCITDTSLCNHWPFALEPTPSFYSINFINWWAKCLFFVLSRLPSSLWVSRTGSASYWCALQEALYKCIDTIQYNTACCQF